MSGGDFLFYFTFFILPTGILVSSIWTYVLLRKGVLLPPRRPESVYQPSAEHDEDLLIEPAGTLAVSAVDADGDIGEPGKPTSQETLEMDTLVTQQSEQDDAEGDEQTESTAVVPLDAEGIVVGVPTPVADALVIDEEIHPLGGVDVVVEQVGADVDEDAAGRDAAESATDDELAASHDASVEAPGESTVEPSADETEAASAETLSEQQTTSVDAGRTRRKPSRRPIASLRSAGEEPAPTRRLTPASRRVRRPVSVSQNEGLMQSGNGAVDLVGGDHERNVELARPLGNGNNVDVLGTHRPKDPTGDTGSATHSTADYGDDREIAVSDDRQNSPAR
jgi:hypothetical protein